MIPPLIAHPRDPRRLGLLVTKADLATISGGQETCCLTDWRRVIWNGSRYQPEGDRPFASPPHSWFHAWLRRQEFDPDRPHEILEFVSHQRWGIFYL